MTAAHTYCWWPSRHRFKCCTKASFNPHSTFRRWALISPACSNCGKGGTQRGRDSPRATCLVRKGQGFIKEGSPLACAPTHAEGWDKAVEHPATWKCPPQLASACTQHPAPSSRAALTTEMNEELLVYSLAPLVNRKLPEGRSYGRLGRCWVPRSSRQLRFRRQKIQIVKIFIMFGWHSASHL